MQTTQVAALPAAVHHDPSQPALSAAYARALSHKRSSVALQAQLQLQCWVSQEGQQALHLLLCRQRRLCRIQRVQHRLPRFARQPRALPVALQA